MQKTSPFYSHPFKSKFFSPLIFFLCFVGKPSWAFRTPPTEGSRLAIEMGSEDIPARLAVLSIQSQNPTADFENPTPLSQRSYDLVVSFAEQAETKFVVHFRKTNWLMTALTSYAAGQSSGYLPLRNAGVPANVYKGQANLLRALALKHFLSSSRANEYRLVVQVESTTANSQLSPRYEIVGLHDEEGRSIKISALIDDEISKNPNLLCEAQLILKGDAL